MGNFIEEIIDKDLQSGKVKNIKVRFPPEPNGYLHIGHAKAICLNANLAAKYGGTLYLRFDDTNPLKEEVEFVNSIIDDVKWLSKVDKILYASDYFDQMFDCAVLLINKGLAYIDDITPEQMKLTRGTLTAPGVDSPNRNRPKEESLKLFYEMKDGKYRDGEYVLRAKIDMKSPNLNMRDPIIYRIVHAAHHRQGDKWCIYPMYDFAHPLEDAIEKITHSCCTLEFEDHRPLYDWFVNNCDFDPKPNQYEFARLNIKRTIMSKRYLKKLVDEKLVEGWDDPRMPTLSGLRRRGYTANAIKEFCKEVGVSKANSEVETHQLESPIRNELNLTAKRAMVVTDPIKLVITNLDAKHTEKLDFEYSLGEKTVNRKISFSNTLYMEKDDFSLEPPKGFHRLTIGGTVRLKSAYIIECTDVHKDKNGEVVTVYAKIIPNSKSGNDTSGVKTKAVIHWCDSKTCVPVVLNMYDYLLIDGDEDKDFSERLNPSSLIVKNGFAESDIKKAKKGESFQFLRQGYFVRDIKNDGLVFNKIVGLKDSFKKS